VAADGDGEASEASEWDAREQAEREAERREEEAALGAEVRGAITFFLTILFLLLSHHWLGRE